MVINQLDPTNQKTITMHGTLPHPEAKVHSLYMKVCKDEPDLISLWEGIDNERKNVTEYLVNSEQDLLQYAANVEEFTNNGLVSANKI